MLQKSPDPHNDPKLVRLHPGDPDARREDRADRAYGPGSPRRIIAIGLAVVLVAFGGLGTWAALAPLDSAARAVGQVVLESERRVVQHPEGGVVHRVVVQEGDRVSASDPVIELDATEAAANFRAVRQMLNSALARRARLIAERDRAADVTFPSELRKLEKTGEQAAEAIAQELQRFRERRQTKAGQIAIYQQQIQQRQDRIDGLSAERVAKREELEIFREELTGLRALEEKGYYPRTKILERERRMAALRGSVGALTADIAETRNAISEAQLQIQQVDQEFRERVTETLSEVNDRVAELRERLVVATQRLDRTVVRAPDDGIVYRLSVHTVGGVVRPGEEIMHVVPVDEGFRVKAEVSPGDIDLVSAGQTASVRMTGLSGRTTPVLAGEVTYVSPDRIVTSSESDSGPERAYFEARIEIPHDEVEKLGAQRLQAGMPAEVMINTGEQTVLAYLARPFLDAIARGFIEK